MKHSREYLLKYAESHLSEGEFQNYLHHLNTREKLVSLGFSERTSWVLMRNRLHTAEAIQEKSDEELLSMREIGVTRLAEMRRIISPVLPLQ